MKKIIISILILLFMFNLSAYALETENIPVDLMVNDNYIKTDVDPFISNNSTYVPIRFVIEALNVEKIEWNEKTSSVTIKDGPTEIILTIGRNYALVNNKKVNIENSVILKDDRTFVPVRFVAETFGTQVTWDNKYFIVGLNKQGITVPQNIITQKTSLEDILWLGKIINAESGGEQLSGKIAVGNVILNRVKSPEYPDTIYDVIFDNAHGIQFQPTANGTIYNNPSPDSIKAAKYSLRGVNVAGDSLFFLNPRISTSFWIVENRTFYASIGNHDFYV